MRIKICGLTRSEQASAIANMGASVLGFICVEQSPRYVSPAAIRSMTQALPPIDRFGVFANESLDVIQHTATIGHLSGIQLHGQESPIYCQQLRTALPKLELIKAIRLRQIQDLHLLQDYVPYVDTFLLDAYHPDQLGGTGQPLDWQTLQTFRPQKPWFLAGGLNPDNIQQALSLITPNGIDLSSGVEKSPGDKDLEKVAQLITNVKLAIGTSKPNH